MNEAAFVETRESDWQRLTHLCDRAERTPTALTSSEFREFVRLYRNVSTDLATARASTTNLSLIQFLNDLAGRTYGLLYYSRRRPFGAAMAEAARTAARTVRRRRAFILASVLIFCASGVFSYAMLALHPDAQDVVVGGQMKEVFDQWKSGLMPERSGSESIGAWLMYASNNPLVAIMSGAIAASTFGVGTVVSLTQNGRMLGALSQQMASVGKMGYLFASILPHGVPELSGMIVSGAAGLCMGWALICPGRMRRRDALAESGKDAVVLLAAAVVLMFIAAPIEGFFSFNPRVPSSLKVLVIVAEIFVWGLFWTGFGKTDEERGLSLAEREP